DEEPRCITFSPDGRFCVTWSDRGKFFFLNGDGDRLDERDEQGWRSISCHCTTLAFSADGGTLALADAGQGVVLYDTHDWREGPDVGPDLQDAVEIQFPQLTPDGNRLALIAGDVTPRGPFDNSRRRLHFYALTDDSKSRERALPFFVRVADVSPDGRYLAYVVHDEQHSPG